MEKLGISPKQRNSSAQGLLRGFQWGGWDPQWGQKGKDEAPMLRIRTIPLLAEDTCHPVSELRRAVQVSTVVKGTSFGAVQSWVPIQPQPATY